MGLKLEYKASLKSTDSEEILDLLIYRPLSFLFVKSIIKTNITPNQISYAALFFGVLAGFFYAYGVGLPFTLAATSFFICNTLDCADGQLARLKHNGTKVGRIIDGFIDYITAISTFIGIGLALKLSGTLEFPWILTIVAALSRAFQNMSFDFYRNMYLRYVYYKVSGIDEEIKEFEEEKERLKNENGSGFEKFLVNIYIKYSKMQKNVNKVPALKISPEEYKLRNQFILRLWSWIGSTTHLTLAIVFTLLDRVDIYLYLIITLGNFILIVLFLIQKRIISTIPKGNV